MQSYFKIFQSCSDKERPPISYKVREYFEEFISENVFSKMKIAVGGKWQIILSIHFTEGGKKVLFKRMALSKGVTTVTTENKKIYDLFILTDEIKKSFNPQRTTIDLMYEAITLFLTSTYKKVTLDFMVKLQKQIDMSYLLSLDYPAPFEEQKYLLDEQLFKKEADGTIRPTTLEEQAKHVGYKGII